MTPFQLAILLNMRQKIPQTPFLLSNHLEASVSLVTHCSASPIDHYFHSLSLSEHAAGTISPSALAPAWEMLNPTHGVIASSLVPVSATQGTPHTPFFHWEDVLPGGILRSCVRLVHLAASVQLPKKPLYLNGSGSLSQGCRLSWLLSLLCRKYSLN